MALRPVEPFANPDGRSDPAHEIRRAESEWARKTINELLWIFYVLNAVIIVFILAIWIVEQRQGLPATQPRIVTERVLISLIAASAAQLGALAFSMGRRLAR